MVLFPCRINAMNNGPLAPLLKATPNFALPPVFLLNKNEETWKMKVSKEEEHDQFSQLGLAS